MPSQKKRKRKVKRKIKVSTGAKLVHKNDATRVDRKEVFPSIQGRPPASVAPVFRIKVKKKR